MLERGAASLSVPLCSNSERPLINILSAFTEQERCGTPSPRRATNAAASSPVGGHLRGHEDICCSDLFQRAEREPRPLPLFSLRVVMQQRSASVR
ncbi:hypothetical protein FQA47_010561 [Oryzias melastigma]|uniref:Uncharacterized protein n=1 Tax=Oryzias melastigma TaxID=30732 RepID=A0A834CDZ9_ORYME|nr:hypothetical protein FQA47_010561 [Oryzias melastigma]